MEFSRNLVINASTDHLAEVREFTGRHAEQAGLNRKAISELQLAVDEACTNIIKHAYNYDQRQKVIITADPTGDGIRITLRHEGRPFDPELYSKPDLRQQISRKKRGGVGVWLMETLMDRVEFVRKAEYNEIHLIKHRQSSERDPE
ncbi:MAG: ATP-binding protein [Balneolaceae bacterium]